jgi:hypothetical protein
VAVPAVLLQVLYEAVVMAPGVKLFLIIPGQPVASVKEVMHVPEKLFTPAPSVVLLTTNGGEPFSAYVPLFIVAFGG